MNEKAQWLVSHGHVRQIDATHWEVDSQTVPGKSYRVYFRGTGGNCECKGFEFRKTCPHLEAVRLEQPLHVPLGEILE